ncbi:hypothetical protein [Shewanella sp. TC10]|uniref:hypothetical protein n=1 Tax=Shewanella sp. TC10 TaxID=1419739 RepID=UPI00129D6AEA|nr:hypothetical protein [Shewanella sp. TC10]
MRNKLRHSFIVFTLLTLLSQVMLTNGSLMINNANAHEAPMKSMQVEKSHHKNNETADSDCCKTAQAPQQAIESTNCCEGKTSCELDCNHCLVITVTGTLLNFLPWPGNNISDIAMATPMPHFHSISLLQDLRPPIA